MTPIHIKDLGTDTVLGLRKELRVWSVYINAETEIITVYYRIYTISPTGVDVDKSDELNYVRYNSPTNPAFDNWRNSSIGQGITQAITITLAKYPNIDQEA